MANRWLRSGYARRDFLAGMALSLSLIALSAAAAWALVALFSLVASMAFIHRHRRLGLHDFGNARVARRRQADRSAAARRRSQCMRAKNSRTSSGVRQLDLNQDKVLRASLESLSESTCDGIVAPLFYLFLGGVPLAMAYKAVSTLDSMIGYRTERYFYFGKFAARLDDAMNFIPARLTALFIVIATLAVRLNPARALRVAWRDHANHLSPNAGYPEAALAGAFGIRSRRSEHLLRQRSP